MKARGMEVHNRDVVFLGNFLHGVGVRRERRPGMAIFEYASGHRCHEDGHAADLPSIINVLAQVVLKIAIGIGRAIAFARLIVVTKLNEDVCRFLGKHGFPTAFP